MARNLTRKLIEEHLVEGAPRAGEGIGLRIDQTLTQDATGTLVMLELDAMGLERVRTETSVQYVDHNLVQSDHRNPDDHLFLRSACRRFGLWYSAAGNGVSHPVHQERFGRPGATLLGSDSHTPAAGALGMLAIGAGGIEVALAMAGEPYHLPMPRVRGVRLTGRLPSGVSAKDVILELLRRHGVRGGVGEVIEYFGPGLEDLSAMDRHVIANMGTELGATSSVFPSDDETRRYLGAQRREHVWVELAADEGASYDATEELDLSRLEPLIAMPSSPGNVVPVREVAGRPIHQAYVGSSANPGYRDFAVCAAMMRGRRVAPGVSFDLNPASRQILATLVRDSQLGDLIAAGGRIHQTGCNGCIGMGQAPATETISLRTVPRNFPGRSGTREDQVCLVSPETAAASALHGAITDPREAGTEVPRVRDPDDPVIFTRDIEAPPPAGEPREELRMGPNIVALPAFEPLPETIEATVALVVGDDVSTDEILPAGMRVLPYRSNVEALARFAFSWVDEGYTDRALESRDTSGHIIVAGDNYGQGSSREHAALVPRWLGLRAVVARSFARIHRQNLIAHGVLPLVVEGDAGESIAGIATGDALRIPNLRRRLEEGAATVRVECPGRGVSIEARHGLCERQIGIVLEGGLIRRMRERHEGGG